MACPRCLAAVSVPAGDAAPAAAHGAGSVDRDVGRDTTATHGFLLALVALSVVGVVFLYVHGKMERDAIGSGLGITLLFVLLDVLVVILVVGQVSARVREWATTLGRGALAAVFLVLLALAIVIVLFATCFALVSTL